MDFGGQLLVSATDVLTPSCHPLDSDTIVASDTSFYLPPRGMWLLFPWAEASSLWPSAPVLMNVFLLLPIRVLQIPCFTFHTEDFQSSE